MASSGAFNTGGYQGRKLRFEWWENAQSIEGNYTDIGYRLIGYGDATSTWYMAGNFKLVVNGSNVYETAESNRIKLYNGTVLKTGTMRIYHNADGSKSFSASATGGIYTYARNVSGSGSWALDAIPRAATISSAPNFTDEDEPVLKYSNPAGSVVDDLQACIASTDGSTIYIDYRPISETGSSYTFSFTDEERETLQALCKNAKSMAVKFYIRTKLGSSTLYSSVEKTLTIANAAPTLAPTVKDSNATTKALTGDESKFIKGHSSAAYTIGASAKKQATIKSQKVTCGDKSATAASGTLAKVESGTFAFSVTDSRGNTATKTLTKTLIDYVALTCSMKVGTPTADGKCAMSISGDCFNGSFGAVVNTLQVQYRQSTDGGSTWGAWVDAAATLSGNGYSAEVAITGLDYQQAYTFQARAVDKLATAETATKTVKATPVFDWGEDSFNFNVPVTMRNAAVLFGTNPEGESRAMVQMNADGDSFFGYGGYVNAEGRTFFDGNEVYIRSKEGVYIDGNLVADVPVAEGTSGIWTWRKWASGKAECWGINIISSMSASSWQGVYMNATTVSLPFTFTEIEDARVAVNANGSNIVYGTVASVSGTSIKYYHSSPNDVITGRSCIEVKGRWK
jgi:hypothetical protein